MFHVEHIMIPFSAVALVAAAELPEQVSTTPCPAPLELALATDNPTAQQAVKAAMLDLLLGWNESARVHFARAVEADNTCTLAYAGLWMTDADPARLKENLANLTEKFHQSAGTPIETFYISCFLKLLSNDQLGAAEDFCSRAAIYKNDVLSACWGILLLHCADLGYDEQGRALTRQARALELAGRLYAERPENPLVCFVRAYVEEAAPEVSKQALEAAAKAAALLPEHPVPSHLLGHLLYRSKRAEEAVPHFMKAVTLATRKDIPEWESSQLMTSRLYVSTAMWSCGQNAKALATRRVLSAMPLNREHLHAPAVILQRWEAATLPLRVLVASPEVSRTGLITAAAAAAEVKPPLPWEDPVLHVRDCLRATLYARLRAHSGNTEHATRSLALAEDALKKFELTREDVLARGIHYITPWMRALEACQVALSKARAEVYVRTSDMWEESARMAVRPVTLMLPPVIPELQIKATASPQKGKKQSTKSRRNRNKKR